MHDIKNRLIEVGDIVLLKDWSNGKLCARKVNQCFPQNSSCNISVYDFEPRLGFQSYNANEAEIVLKHDGSKPEEVK